MPCKFFPAFQTTEVRRGMRSAKLYLSAGVLCGLAAALALSGCETGRTNKLHSRFESVSDVSTVPHPLPQFASVNSGNPPVPGSPTAAGPDGRQPMNDNQARNSPGSEGGIPMAPERQPKSHFVRQ